MRRATNPDLFSSLVTLPSFCVPVPSSTSSGALSMPVRPAGTALSHHGMEVKRPVMEPQNL